MTLDVILNYCAVAAATVAVLWGEIGPLGWVALLAILIFIAIIGAIILKSAMLFS